MKQCCDCGDVYDEEQQIWRPIRDNEGALIISNAPSSMCPKCWNKNNSSETTHKFSLEEFFNLLRTSHETD